jgi:hypothetical protein
MVIALLTEVVPLDATKWPPDSVNPAVLRSWLPAVKVPAD